MKFVFSPDVILCGWLGSKHQLSNVRSLTKRTFLENLHPVFDLKGVFCFFVLLFLSLKNLFWRVFWLLKRILAIFLSVFIDTCFFLLVGLWRSAGSLRIKWLHYHLPFFFFFSLLYLLFFCPEPYTQVKICRHDEHYVFQLVPALYFHEAWPPCTGGFGLPETMTSWLTPEVVTFCRQLGYFALPLPCPFRWVSLYSAVLPLMLLITD